MFDEMPTKDDEDSLPEVLDRVSALESKVEELEKAIWAVIKNMEKNVEILGNVHETFQNLDAYLKVNVGPPLFID